MPSGPQARPRRQGRRHAGGEAPQGYGLKTTAEPKMIDNAKKRLILRKMAGVVYAAGMS
jgi:hypothetical protein